MTTRGRNLGATDDLCEIKEILIYNYCHFSVCLAVLRAMEGPCVHEVTDGSRQGTSGICVLHVCDLASWLFSAARIAATVQLRPTLKRDTSSSASKSFDAVPANLLPTTQCQVVCADLEMRKGEPFLWRSPDRSLK
jgi:hypothetical protein